MMVETRQPAKVSARDALRWVDTLPHDSRVLSALVDASPERVESEAFLITFRSGASSLRSSIRAEEHGSFDAACSRIEHHFASPFSPPARGLAVYATLDGATVTVPLPFVPDEEVAWSARPLMEPLIRALDDHERVAVVLIDKERTRFFTIFLGEIEERAGFVDEVEGKHAGGGWYALEEKRIARHHEDQVLRHVKRTASMLSEELRTHPYDRLLIGGPEEAVSLLRHHLPDVVAQRFAGPLRVELFAPEAEILRLARASAAKAERRTELADVRDLLDSNDDHAVVGLENTLHALFTSRAAQVLMSDELPRRGRRCVDCGRLTMLRPCPVCAGETDDVGNLREEVIGAARRIGARIDLVSGPAASALVARGGLAAWTRHSQH